MELFEKTGKIALGSRLRYMASNITEEAARIHELYQIEFAPKWFPVFFILSEGDSKTITDIATEIGHSQPSVTKIVKEMIEAGLLEDNLRSMDKRRNMVGLSNKGKMLWERMKIQCIDIDRAIDGIIQEATHNLWEALAEWEFLLQQKSLLKRVQEQKKMRESKDINIVPYNPAYRLAFKSLNEEWISTYFELEEADHKALDNPEEYILAKGGKIMVALYNDKPVGVSSLIKMNHPDFDYELAKMVVSPTVQGKNIGYLLGKAIIEEAKTLGASKLFLESNTILKPAINLYHKLGFQKINGFPSTYQRCNIQMELDLKK
ncbi:bifunctional helix-turn-helix transcriptional regulator/GNAT family N-acetyltransferase [Sphingobacterium multivorum]|uniref:bifunctional helix-turn-helix transcriptional regulator/GNAT family N-acetyltransferase n=1 Tax=Sphingobacterium multivorum TaxID=28454 RepID=UPI00289D66D5|nr:helix-turn-helix domain-containing GNAT family N-acetyltransferase [Sphingobacterium multivorum]